MRNMIDIITRLQMTAQEGSRADRELAAMVLKDPDFASIASISDIAQRIGVSEPTVTRFCRTLGCEGVRDFKFRLAQAIAVGGQYLKAEPIDGDTREQRIANLVAEGAIAAISSAVKTIDMAEVATAAQRIAGAGQILCVGSGGTSSMMATEMQNRLFRLGLTAVAQVDGQLQRMFAAVATPSTVVLAFSTSGYAQSVVDAVQVARQYGAHTVSLTAPGSALAQSSHNVVPVLTFEDGNLYKPTASRFAMLAMVDILAMAVAEARGPKVLEGLRRIKLSINTLKVENPALPIGD